MIIRNAKIVFIAHLLILLSGVATSLLSAWALGPAGRGDLLIITLWPPVCALLVNLGLPQAHRYWIARKPELAPQLFSNAIIYGVFTGSICLIASELIIPKLIGKRSPEVILLVRIYLLNIPAALSLDLLRSILEGARKFVWAGFAKTSFFVIQALSYLALWATHSFNLRNAAICMMVSQAFALGAAFFAVRYVFKPGWKPDWSVWKTVIRYGVRDYPGVVTEFTTLRMDQLFLGGVASSAALGLYAIAVRLSEITTLAAESVADALMPAVTISEKEGNGEVLLGRVLRLTIYTHAIVIIPLWIVAPYFLHFVFGPDFMPATSALRWLLIAAVIWSVGTILLSGLAGLGHPGLSSVARFSAAVITIISLVILLPRNGIVGAAQSSVIGYGSMAVVAFVALLKRRKINFADWLRPRKEDLPLSQIRTMMRAAIALNPE